MRRLARPLRRFRHFRRFRRFRDSRPALALLPVVVAVFALVAPRARGAEAGSARVQGPDAPWRTIVTEHYRIHYPSRPEGDFAPFARDVASRIEGIHRVVVAAVGWEAKGPIQVVIRDPVGEANGLAVPLVGQPLVELWRTEPESDSSLGHERSWAELVTTHELVHIHHLLRPQSAPTLLEKLLALPVGPLARKAPRWVVEGYATLLEGRLTGTGRPSSPYRAAVLREWAREGKLPAYDALSRTGGFRGGGMAYLVGSAFLEWLERQEPATPDVLVGLWKRLASRRRRGFDDAFRATFGRSARDAYDRFRAEVTHDALELERAARTRGIVEGTPFTRVEGDLTDLAVSPDGTRLLARVLPRKGPGLAVWDLDGARPARRERTGARDADVEKRPAPDAPADVAPRVPVVEPASFLPRVDGAVGGQPRWLDAERVGLFLKRPDAEGVLVLRPAVWTPGEDRLREGVPLPPAPVSVERDGAGFRARVDGVELSLPFEPIGPVAVDARRRFVWGTATVDGIWNVVRAPLGRGADGLSAGPVEVLTRTAAACWGPAPVPDGSAVFFARLTATGVEVRRLAAPAPLPGAEAPLASASPPFAPGTVLPPPGGADLLPPPVEPPSSAPYDAWAETKVRSRSTLSISPSGTSYGIGVGGRDVIGRLAWQLLGVLGDGAGPRGASGALAYRGLPFAPAVRLFSLLERPSSQRFVAVEGVDRQRTGGELSFEWRSLASTRLTLRPALAAERIAPQEPSSPSATRLVAGLDASVARSVSRGDSWGLSAAAAATLQAGRTSGDPWSLLRVRASLGLGTPLAPFGARVEAGWLGGTPGTYDLFRLGGPDARLTAPSLEAVDLAQAALPSFLATGDRLLSLRGWVGGTVRLYLEHAAVWSDPSGRPAFQRIAGLELSLDRLVSGGTVETFLGRLGLTAGLHRTLDGELRGRTVATLVLTAEP